MDYVDCERSSRIDFKTLWPRNGHADSLGVKLNLKFISKKNNPNLATTIEQTDDAEMPAEEEAPEEAAEPAAEAEA